MKNKKHEDSHYRAETRLIYGKSPSPSWEYTHHLIPPITASSSFRLESAERGRQGFGQIGQISTDPLQAPIYVYDRMGEPNNDLLQSSLAIAEGGEIAVTFASGMAAVHAAVCFSLEQGDEIISHKTVYGCTYSLFSSWLKKLGVKVHFVDLVNPQDLLPLVNEKTRVIYLESPANPTLQLLDLEAIGKIQRQLNQNRSRKILSVIDNTFATPFAQRPLQHGIDLVLHSLTKGISGFGVDMGGAIITRSEFLEPLILFRKDFGGMLASNTAWHIMVYGLSTLALRYPKQQANAQRVAEYLKNHPLIETVLYPGLPSFPQAELARRILIDYDGNFAPGFMIYFILKGDTPEQALKRGETLMNFLAQRAYCISLAVSLGQLRTLIEHPGSMTHASYPPEEQIALGIDPGGIRLAVGIESHLDIISDLEAGLNNLASEA